jgi:hypothetical protein
MAMVGSIFNRREMAVMMICAVVPPFPARADQPPAAPASFTVKSRSGRYSAVLDFPAHQVSVFEVRKTIRSRLWAIQGWSPVAAIADAGPILALGHPGNNLLPLDANEKTVIISLYQGGSLVREVTLGEIIPMARLRRTISHVEWGTHIGFDAKSRYVVVAEDKRLLAFRTGGDPETLPR